jgi:hypothetical protein
MLVTSIVPRLPKAVDGVGDYAFNLARQLRKELGIETHFIVGDPTWTGSDRIEGFSVSRVNSQSAATLLSLLPGEKASTSVLLHYVHYGYAKRGCPFWLVDGLQRWRMAGKDRSLITMFHELYSFGPPWASSFWLSPVQKNLAVRLALLSDRCLTSKQTYAEILHRFRQGKQTKIPTLPVFSTIGEPEHLPSLTERPRRLVVFGVESNRLRVYQRSLTAVKRACEELEIEEILDIGPPINLDSFEVNNVPLIAMGSLPAPELSKILSNAIAGFFNYRNDYLAKSTIFAAYCAHRLIPIGTFYSDLQLDGLEAGKHYWLADLHPERLNLTAGAAIADNAHRWYQTHNLSAQAKIFAAQLTNQV